MSDLTTKEALLERMVSATDTLAKEVPSALDEKLPLSGGQMTGPISGNPLTLKADDGNGNATDFVINPNGSVTLGGNRVDYKTVLLSKEVTLDFSGGKSRVTTDADGVYLTFSIPEDGTKILFASPISATTNALSFIWGVNDTLVRIGYVYFAGSQTPTYTMQCYLMYR